MEDPSQATEWLMQLISVVPTDSRALCKLGELYDGEGDKSQAFQHYYEVGVPWLPSARGRGRCAEGAGLSTDGAEKCSLAFKLIMI